MFKNSDNVATGRRDSFRRVLTPSVLLSSGIYALVCLLPRLRDDGKPLVQRLRFPVTLLLFCAVGMVMSPFGAGPKPALATVGCGMNFWQLLAAALTVLAGCWSVGFALKGQLSGMEPVAVVFRVPPAPANAFLARLPALSATALTGQRRSNNEMQR